MRPKFGKVFVFRQNKQLNYFHDVDSVQLPAVVEIGEISVVLGLLPP